MRRSFLLVACVFAFAFAFAFVSASAHLSLFDRLSRDISASGQPNGTLPTFASIGKLYVAGVSSGGYMAGQLHVAYSSQIAGAGIFAAGPWGCAAGNLDRALTACTDDSSPLALPDLLDAATAAASIDTIDAVSNLAHSPVWIFHGLADSTVKKPIVDALAAFYGAFGADVAYNNVTMANHAWVSPLGANPCSVSAAPYTSQCGLLDPQAEMLAHILSRDVQPPNKNKLTGQITPFSQDSYAAAKWDLAAYDLSMDTTGYIYVPAACANKTVTCDVMTVLHGCEQSVSIVGMDLIDQANMNQYADTNGLIVLYPQTIALEVGVVLNPKACWDWWGYLADDELYANHGSFQMEVIMNMMNSLKA